MRDAMEVFEWLKREVSAVTKNVPSSHGAPHLFKVAEIAVYLAKRLGTDIFITMITGLIHDLRFWDEEECKIRKLNIPDHHTAGKTAAQILVEIPEVSDWFSRTKILAAIAEHSKLPEKDKEAPLLLQILRDADRLSRLGYEGLLSILTANRFYGVPFYNEGDKILWTPAEPLYRHEDIKSAINDCHDVLTRWQIMETTPGKMMFLVMSRVNIIFLEALESSLFLRSDGYTYWIGWIEKILKSQAEIREAMADPKIEILKYEAMALEIEESL